MLDSVKELLQSLVLAHPFLYLTSAFAIAFWVAACAYWWWNQEHALAEHGEPSNGGLLLLTSLSALLGVLVIVISVWPEIPQWLRTTRVLFLIGAAVVCVPLVVAGLAQNDARHLRGQIAKYNRPKKPDDTTKADMPNEPAGTAKPQSAPSGGGLSGFALTTTISSLLGVPIILLSVWSDPPSWVKPTSILSGVGVAVICFASMAFGFAHHRWLKLKGQIAKLEAAKKGDEDRRMLVAAKLGLDP